MTATDPSPTLPRITLSYLKSAGRKGGTKNSQDPFWPARYVYRPVSIYLTWLAYRLGLSANGVTFLSGVLMFAAAPCFGVSVPAAWIVGALLVNLYLLLDHVDGELGRVERLTKRRSTGMSGVFYDTACHAGELAVCTALAMRLYRDLNGAWWVLLVAVTWMFPGNIGPWQRYSETLVAYARGHVRDGFGVIPADFLGAESVALSAFKPATDLKARFRRVAAFVLQGIGFPRLLSHFAGLRGAGCARCAAIAHLRHAAALSFFVDGLARPASVRGGT